jgi:hypothetical protein
MSLADRRNPELKAGQQNKALSVRLGYLAGQNIKIPDVIPPLTGE